MQKQDRREFLKKLMVGASSVGAVAMGAKVLENKESKDAKQVLYTRNKTWEFYYKQAR